MDQNLFFMGVTLRCEDVKALAMKCSTSTAQLIKRSAAKLQYKVLVGSTMQWEIFGSKNHEAIKSEIQYAIKHRRPWQYPRLAYVAHFYYSTIYNLSYTYINMVRDPLDRYLSHYYYQRYGDRPKEKLKEMRNLGQFNESLQDCFQQQHQGCELNVMTRFFCGYDKYCALGNQRALRQAKRNILTNYAVIGLLEEWDLSSQLFRKILPNFFTQINEKISRYKVNKNRKNEPLSPGLIKSIKEANQADYKLYRFIKQLFWTRVTKCGLQNGME
ncbi:uncharacterized protein TRIADDRAFT_58255 [Trichoplax adhaerens]|uniref:Sulfotransferase domain-containing protein n=1 Tax=Trichoplax adhaerens TaxID=10228 RepID=B3S1A5_TRIAD|nr:hypothetical protein TRIADDRAFT_58255 [Trichoplax adhaerens]EDV23527.1 hypothetical protein TRIADDRAFT_58255 [Trichoplax adhaerens]|eukprot:XP_002114437.1 hypothetical protein TRIADDRAFT_58255 [Trichoplax adhaerens]